MSLLQRFAAQLHAQGLTAPQQRVAIAVSGGSDSLALALLTAWWRGRPGPSLPSPPAATQAAPPPPAEAPSLPPPEDLLGTARRLLRASAALPTSSASAGSERAGPQAGHQSEHATGPVRHGGTALALVVDHRLRPASGAEAAATAELVRGWGLQPVLLRAEWPGGRPIHGAMMAGARAARQRLFHEACQRHDVNNLLLAHQAGDQAETFLMRLSRASGVNGLAGMAQASMLTVVDSTASSLHTLGGGGGGGVGSDDGGSDSGRGAGRDAAGAGSNVGIRLLRPLLGVHRAELRQLLRSCGVPWIDDPTNEDRSYARNAIRAMLAAPPNRSQPANGVPETAGPIGSEGSAAQHASAAAAALTPPPVVSDMLRLQGRCAAAQQEMQCSAGQLLRACIPERQPAGATPNTWQLALAPLAAAPKPAVMRALAAVLQAVSGNAVPPKQDALLRLWRMVRTGLLASGFSGGGCVVKPVAGSEGTLAAFRQQATATAKCHVV